MDFPDGFEWDEDKRQANLSKHGIDFREVPKMFDGPMLPDYDHRHSGREDRWRALGFLNGRVVFCVYTMRGQRHRLITARPATRSESMLYFERFWFDPLT